MKLLLFDIDLTLISTGGAGRRAMTHAFERLFDEKDGLEDVDFAGRTDPLILKDALARKGLAWSAEYEDAFKRLYFPILREEIAKSNPQKRLMPGIPEVLATLRQEDDVRLGLLTGNWRDGALIKLQHFDLERFFAVGAFADDSEIREELPEVAARRFTQTFGQRISPADVYIIGDTPLDVACARPFGARSVAVATGFFSVDELKKAQPDFLFPDLSDYQEFLNILHYK